MTKPAPPSGEAIGRSQLPWREVFSFAWLSLRLRLGRMVLVALGISFAIAFFAALLGAETILSGLQRLAARRQGTLEDDMQSLRRWWVLAALLMAAAGIANAVLMSVTERIQEIGTLKCLGARGLHIVELFLVETVLLGGAGGLAGGLLGVLACVALFGAKWGSDLWRVFGAPDALRIVGLSVGVSLLLSLVSALIPVFVAAKIEPAEAMRHEG